MARVPMAELAVAHQQPGLVRASPAGGRGGDVRQWAEQSSISAGAMMAVGAGLAAIGGLAATFVMGFVGTAVAGSMITVGGGLALLGVLKRKGRQPDTPPMLPPSSSTAVIAERSRRVAAVLERTGTSTFERLTTELRWTEPALLETLVVMKESGQLVEDLDLDSGEWFYRLQTTDYGDASAMTLADRQARQLQSEGNR